MELARGRQKCQRNDRDLKRASNARARIQDLEDKKYKEVDSSIRKE